jgi:hypothetical protein
MVGDGRMRIAHESSAPNGGYNLVVNAAGGRVFQGRYTLADGENEAPECAIVLTEGGVDPFEVPLEDLRNFRGSIWTARAPQPFGPRPGSPDNILAMDYYEEYDQATRDLCIAEYVGRRRYRQCCVGPFVDGGYHGLYPEVDIRVDPLKYARALEELWNRGAYPVTFLGVDNWTLDDMRRELEPIFRRPEFQRVVRLAVPHGWEPGGYNVSNEEWCEWFAWAQDVFPRARLGLHMISDFDAPIGGNDGAPIGTMTKQQAWTNVYNAGCRFFLRQVGGYVSSGNPVPTSEFIANFQADLAWFVRNFGAWGLDIDVIAGEYAAFIDFWGNAAEAYSVEIGDAAMQVPGVRGFFDGGTAR